MFKGLPSLKPPVGQMRMLLTISRYSCISGGLLVHARYLYAGEVVLFWRLVGPFALGILIKAAGSSLLFSSPLFTTNSYLSHTASSFLSFNPTFALRFEPYKTSNTSGIAENFFRSSSATSVIIFRGMLPELQAFFFLRHPINLYQLCFEIND